MNSVEDWFDKHYVENYKMMVKIAYRLLNDWELANDIVQTAFLKMLTKYDKLKHHPNIRGWLGVTVKNLVGNERQKAYYRLEVPLHLVYEPTLKEPPPDFRSVLPPGLKEEEIQLLCLYFEEELPHEKIAAQLGCTPTACRMRLKRAKQHCHDLMEKNEFL